MSTVEGQGVPQVVSNNFVRPANATPYASGQLVANSTVAASVLPLAFISSGPSIGVLCIQRVRLKKSSVSTTNASFRVHFYDADPSASSGIVNGDGAAWSTSAAHWLGAMDVVIATAFSDGSAGIGVANQGTEITSIFTNGRTIYALVEARAAYTPASGETFTAVVETIQG
jgi:hypothetical protein